MHSPRAESGFTLIELLVVIGILGLLIAYFAPDIFATKNSARKAADQANLRWHYQQFTIYNDSKKGLPTVTGHKFVLSPWVKGTCQRTPENFIRYFLPDTPDTRKDELAALDPATIWRDYDDLRSDDTAYAGPGPELVRRRLMSDGTLPVMADDNEFVPAFEDFTINVLMGAGAVREIQIEELQGLGFDGDAEGANFEVGEGSPHKLLKMLEK